MSDNKKYYYLKLNDNFFNRDEIKIIRGMEKGDTYVCIILEMYLRSLKRGGVLMVSEHIPYNVTTLASVLSRSIDEITFAIKVFTELGLIKVVDSGEMYMADIQSFIGSSSTEADRIREYRKRQIVQNPYKCTPEIELEIEKDINTTSISSTGEPLNQKPIKKKPTTKISDEALQVIDYLNRKTDSQYRPKGKTAEVIAARLSDRYTVGDCILVIDSKVKEWSGTEMEKYLRPETLFGASKFDGYLQAARKSNRTALRPSSASQTFIPTPEPSPEDRAASIAILEECSKRFTQTGKPEVESINGVHFERMDLLAGGKE